MKPELSRDGVTINSFLSINQYEHIKDLVVNRVLQLHQVPHEYQISNYHRWFVECEHLRSCALSAKNRHFSTEYWADIDLINLIGGHLSTIFPQYYLNVLDEGLGTSAFRLIRPGFNDGYPPSRKSWGPGSPNLASLCIPLIGFSKHESQGFLLGSHLRDYPSELPAEQKFMKDERRLVDPHLYTFEYFETAPGDAIIYHWDTIHTEQILGNNTTRLALEARFVCCPR